MDENNAADRKAHPIFTGVLKYFPNALLEVAKVSKKGNDQHNPGQPLHWDMAKSTDEGDALVRHQLRAGTRDSDGERHSAKVAWRALAQLERELLAEQAAESGYVQENKAFVADPELAAYAKRLEELGHHTRSDNGEVPIPPAHYEGSFIDLRGASVLDPTGW